VSKAIHSTKVLTGLSSFGIMSKPVDNSDMTTQGSEITASNSTTQDNEKDLVPTPEAAATDSSPDDEPKSLRFKCTIIFLCIISLLASIDSVIVAVCLSSISKDLNTTSVASFWVGTSFLLAQTITIPIYGTLSEIFGRKWAVLTAMAIFLLASILCATGTSVTWLVAARSLQGMGAGGTLSMVQIITSDITTMRERAKYQALSAFAWAVGVTAAVSPLPLHDVIESILSEYRFQWEAALLNIQLGDGHFGSTFHFA
jgi:MFS family permease